MGFALVAAPRHVHQRHRWATTEVAFGLALRGCVGCPIAAGQVWLTPGAICTAAYNALPPRYCAQWRASAPRCSSWAWASSTCSSTTTRQSSHSEHGEGCGLSHFPLVDGKAQSEHGAGCGAWPAVASCACPDALCAVMPWPPDSLTAVLHVLPPAWCATWCPCLPGINCGACSNCLRPQRAEEVHGAVHQARRGGWGAQPHPAAAHGAGHTGAHARLSLQVRLHTRFASLNARCQCQCPDLASPEKCMLPISTRPAVHAVRGG